MDHLTAQLTTTREKRRATTVEDEWKAVKAVLDDFTAKASHPAPPAGVDPPASCGLAMTEGADPKFKFDPYDAVTRLSPGTPVEAWEAESDWVLARLEKLSKLDVEWNREERAIYLTVPVPSPTIMASFSVHADIVPEGRRCERHQCGVSHRSGPRRDNVAPAFFGFAKPPKIPGNGATGAFPNFTFGDTAPAPASAPAPAPARAPIAQGKGREGPAKAASDEKKKGVKDGDDASKP